MKKEVFLAIAIGFGLGLIITFGIWTANKSLKNLPQPTPSPTTTNPTPIPSSTPTTNQQPTNQLTISTPDNEALVTTNSITLTGKTTPTSTIVITYENNESIILADSTGKFTTTINLVSGYNTIVVTAFDKDGNQSTQTLTVTYTTAKV